VAELAVPPGLVSVGGDWLYEEYTNGNSVTNLGLGKEDSGKNTVPLPPGEERNRILDLFRN
jgi:penicillin-binding protein 1A